MEQIKTPQDIEVLEGKKGKYWKITWDDEKTDHIFDPDKIDTVQFALNTGQQVKVTKVKGEKYWNITNVEAIDESGVIKTPERAEKPPETKGKPADRVFKADPIKTDSIEAQVAFKGVVDLIVQDILKLDSLLAKAALDWAMARLAPTITRINHLELEPEPPPEAEKITILKD